MKHLNTLFIFFLFALSLAAQERTPIFEGLVINEVTGEVVVKALVEIDGTPYRELTDVEGKFAFYEKLPNAMLTVAVTKEGFKNHEFLLDASLESIPGAMIEVHPGRSKKRKPKKAIIISDDDMAKQKTDNKSVDKKPEDKSSKPIEVKRDIPEVNTNNAIGQPDVVVAPDNAAITIDISSTPTPDMTAAPEGTAMEDQPTEDIGGIPTDVVSFTGLEIPSAPGQLPSDQAVPLTLTQRYAQLLDVEEEEITNEALYQFIDQWMGMPYFMGGETKYGIDCSSFAQKLCNSVYGKLIERTAAKQFNSMNLTRFTGMEYLEEGDLIFFKGAGEFANSIVHVGIYLKNNKFVHATANKEGTGKGGVKISDLTGAFWTSRFVCGGRRTDIDK